MPRLRRPGRRTGGTMNNIIDTCVATPDPKATLDAALAGMTDFEIVALAHELADAPPHQQLVTVTSSPAQLSPTMRMLKRARADYNKELRIAERKHNPLHRQLSDILRKLIATVTMALELETQP